MSHNGKPSITSADGKTSASITHIVGGGNNNGGYVNVGAEVSHSINKNTDIFANGNYGRSQSFKGHGGSNSWGAGVGFRIKF